MNKKELLNNVSRTFHQVGFKIKKHSPAILVGAGVVGVVASTVLACRATTKVNDVLNESKQTIDRIHECMNTEHLQETGQYTEADGKKDLTITYAKTGLALVKLYAPAVILGSLSITSIVASHHILNKRNIALASAYAAVEGGFKDYRKRVKERFGERVDYELRHNVKAETVEVTEIDENGKEKVVKETVDFIDQEGNPYSVFAKFFDEASPFWTKDPSKNLVFLKQTEMWANDKLRLQGYLFLNDVYEMLGIDKQPYGQVVGWLYRPENPDYESFVDFGIFNANSSRHRAFVNGYERNTLLDFNVQGNILNDMNKF